MYQKLKMAAVALPAIAACTMLVPDSPALAEQPAKIKAMSFTTQNVFNQVIHVVSSGNKKWDRIQPGSVSFGAHVMIDTKHNVLPNFPKGWVKEVGILLGSCGGAACKGKPVLWQATPVTKDYENQMAVTFPTSQMPVSTNGIATVPVGDEIIARCNSKATMDGGKAHSFKQWIPATFVADTVLAVSTNSTGGAGNGSAAGWYHDVDHTRSRSFAVQVQCEPFQRETAEDVPDDPSYGVKDVKLSLSTFSHATTKPNPGTVCKKGRILARLKTTKEGPVKFKLWTKLGNEPMQSQFVEAWSSHSGSEYKAEFTKWVSVSKTTNLKAMVEDMTNPIGQSSGWKDITLHCTGAGGGGLADAPKPGDGPQAAPLKVTGELTLADSAANSDKPRLGQAVFKIWATKPGKTSYKLTCSGNRKWEGTLPTFKVASKKYQAVGAHNFQIAKTEQIGCALRSTSLTKNDVIALASKLFKLVKRNPDVAGPGTVTIPPKPQTGKPNRRPAVIVTPKKPLIKVAPVRKIACIGGKVSRNSCFCPSRTKRVKIGANAYRCIVNVVSPRVPPKRVIKTAPVRRVAPVVQTAPVRRIAPAGKKRRFGRTR